MQTLVYSGKEEDRKVVLGYFSSQQFGYQLEATWVNEMGARIEYTKEKICMYLPS